MKIAFLYDEQDKELVDSHKWYINSSGYVVTEVLENNKRKVIRFHRLVMGALPNQIIDHINRDKTDNRRCNLRFSNRSTNAMNREAQSNSKLGVKGVSWSKQKNMYRVVVQRKHYGFYNDLEQAISASVKARIIEHGEFACV